MTKILITGGSGFLGKNLANKLKVKNQVVIGSRNQPALLGASKISGVDFIPINICSIESIRDALKLHNPDTVIHAAATKYVDWSEQFPLEAIDINVAGSVNLLRACKGSSVKKIIFISTDKSAPPVANIYGLSKAIIERTFALSSKDDLQICCVRYGNVLWSTGSFLHVWSEMKTKDNCIRSTGSDMTRFFFTIDEAISLVETALKNIQHIHSSILSIPMKTATIKSFLDEFCSIHECDYSIVEQRGGERNHEFLIGEAELMYSKSIEFENQTYFQITPNKKQKDALRSSVSSATSPRLTKEEIRSAILNQPVFV